MIRVFGIVIFALTASLAQGHLERGLRLYDLQQYDEAIAEFRAGYAIDPNPQFLYALGQALRKKGDCPAAVEAYRTYLRTAPSARQAQAAADQIARCEASSPAVAAAPSPAPTPEIVVTPPPRRRVYTWVGVSLTAATAITGAALEIAAHQRYSSLLSTCAPPNGSGCGSGDIDSLARQINSATGMWVAAGALGIATIVAIVLESRPRH